MQGEVAPEGAANSRGLTARAIDSGFHLAHDTYNGLSAASDGRIYYILSSQSLDIGAQMYSYDPAEDAVKHLGDINEECGGRNRKAIVQGKCHSRLVEAGSKLYFATHIGYYKIVDGMEHPGSPPHGYEPYPGGYFLSYDLKTERFEDIAIAPNREGFLSMAMDKRRGRLYGITWPTGHFIACDIATKRLKDLGPVSGRGEAGRGNDFRTLCRSLVVNPEDGSVYFTTAEGRILRFVHDSDAIEAVHGEDLRKDYFGLYDVVSPGHMGYNWRQAFWRTEDNAIYGVHGNSGYLFRFDPGVPRVEVLERIASLPSRRSGMFDQFSYGYLGFTLGPDGRTIFYLTGGPIYENGKRVKGKASTAMGESKGKENLHLVTYDIPDGRYSDHGPVFFEDGSRPSYVNSIAVGNDETVYALSRLPSGRTDLIAVPGEDLSAMR